MKEELKFLKEDIKKKNSIIKAHYGNKLYNGFIELKKLSKMTYYFLDLKILKDGNRYCGYCFDSFDLEDLGAKLEQYYQIMLIKLKELNKLYRS